MSRFRKPSAVFSVPKAPEPNYKHLYMSLMEHVERHAYEYTPVTGSPEFKRGWKDAHGFLLRKAVMVDGTMPTKEQGYAHVMYKKIEPEVLSVIVARAEDII
jgi:hypothetical protein